MGNCVSIMHDTKCTNGTNGVMICDVCIENAPYGKKIMEGVLAKARHAWQSKLARITKHTKDFDEVSKKVYNGVLCNVR